jgi:hypothetical protein
MSTLVEPELDEARARPERMRHTFWETPQSVGDPAICGWPWDGRRLLPPIPICPVCLRLEAEEGLEP